MRVRSSVCAESLKSSQAARPIVVDAALTCAFEQGEGSVVGIEHHLLRFARVDPHEQHVAATKPDMGSLQSGR
jgi:hypothetical protein